LGELAEMIVVDFDGDHVVAADIESCISDGSTPQQWSVQLDKLRTFGANGVCVTFFCRLTEFGAWCETLATSLPAAARFSELQPIVIVVPGLEEEFGGACFLGLPAESQQLPPRMWALPPNGPDRAAIAERVHAIGAAGQGIMPPSSFRVNKGSAPSAFARAEARALATALATYLIDGNTISLESPQLDLIQVADGMESEDRIAELRRAVLWAYEEKVDTRVRLVVEGLQIRRGEGETWLASCLDHADYALRRARERYAFVVSELSDVYAAERRDVVREMRSLADQFASKTRALSGALLRDALAGILLVGVTLSVKLATVGGKVDPVALTAIFRVLAGYFAVSATLQSVLHIHDVVRSRRELDVWCLECHDRISEHTVADLRGRTVAPRETGFYCTVLAIDLIYLALAAAAWLYPCFLPGQAQ
jgi:hypothetical protein